MRFNHSKSPYFISRLRHCVLVLFLLAGGSLKSQDFSISGSAAYDPNIFDNYAPTGDQILRSEMNASKDWDIDNLSLNAGYYGSFQFFNTFSVRNYSIHQLSLNSSYAFDRDDSEDDMEETSDSLAEESDSTLESPGTKAVPSRNGDTLTQAEQDSLRHTIFGTLTAMQQFDKSDFSFFDNSSIGGDLAYRIPLGTRTGLRATLHYLYRDYPNIATISSSDYVGTLQLGTSMRGVDWIGAGLHVGTKLYPISGTISDTIIKPGHGHGKGGARPDTLIHNHDFTNPSVSQISYSIDLNSRVWEGAAVTAHFTYFASPEHQARLLENISVQPSQNGLSADENNIIDDHYGYNGPRLDLQVEQAFPFGVSLNLTAGFQRKTYSSPAYNGADSAVADHRLDSRAEGTIVLSRTFHIHLSRTLKPQLGVSFLRNISNAEYYDMSKSMVSIGIELSF